MSNVTASTLKGKERENAPPSIEVKNSLHSPQSSVSFLVDIADIHSMKQNLQDLMTSFRTGKLKAFGDQNAIDQMETIRHMQGTIARKHFGLDSKVKYEDLEDSNADRRIHDTNMTDLLTNLEELGDAIKGLSPQSTSRPHKRKERGESSRT